LILIATSKEEQNEAVLDPWSAVHGGVGLAMGLMGFSLGAAFAAAVVYELLERPFESAEFGRNLFNVSKPEHKANAVADVAVFMVGVEAGRRWNRS
jgi:hypothetical protein